VLEAPLAIVVALAVDHAWGEPPAWAHPVVGMGRWLDACTTALLRAPPRRALVLGALAWTAGALACAASGLALQRGVEAALRPGESLPRTLATGLVLGLLLKPLLAWRLLREEVDAVEAALRESVEGGRVRLARLVSRDTRALAPRDVREAAVETLAENLNDSVVAPLFWFAVAGLPGAALYRFANTADAMWGYRGRWEWAGKVAARADDVLSWPPARLCALALAGRAAASADWRRRLAREAARPASPNGGWPMGAMALRLGLRLGKPGVYDLNADGAPAGADAVADAQRLAARALAAATIVLAALAALARSSS